MGVFNDKKFEELDWMSVAMEPIDSEMNIILASIPDEVLIDFETYKALTERGYGLDLNVSDVVVYFALKANFSLSWKQRALITPCFEFQVDGMDISLDFENKVITGEIRLVKIQTTMDEKTLADYLGSEGLDRVSNMRIYKDGLSRANEVIELLGGCDEGLRTRSDRKKRYIIAKRLREIFKNNEWKIKDTELANKVGQWIASYIQDGQLAALSNFCRLKVMTHKGDPIYSMEEVE